jgi:hypothetical protein
MRATASGRSRVTLTGQDYAKLRHDAAIDLEIGARDEAGCRR